MNKHFVSILLALLCFNFLSAQNQYNIWHFGANAGIDFNPATPVPLLGSQINTPEGCASIADRTTGQLLFYMDGTTIYNRNHVPMFNGTGLLGHASSSQTALILPWPGNPQNYFVFTLDFEGNTNRLRYSVVDMNLAGGFGGVTAVKNQSLVTGQLTEKLAATCVGNGRGHWVVTHGFGNNNLYAFRIGSTGLNPVPVVSSVGPVLSGSVLRTIGTMKFAQDGSRAVLANYSQVQHFLFDFDNTTGIFSNPITIFSGGETYGCEFSPDATKVYLASCCLGPHEVVQHILTINTQAGINASRNVVNPAPIGALGTMQLAPDGRIYIAKQNQPTLAVISNPNGLGASCGYIDNGFPLGGPISRMGLPNIPACVRSIILDAELGAFYADVTANSEVQLHWEAVKKASQGTYEVERSADGAYFYRIGEVPFAGNRPETARIDFLDQNPLPDNNFYRIRVTEPNGDIALSEVVEVAPGSVLGTQVRLSPNPAHDQVELSLYVQGGQIAPWQIKVYSLTGQLVLQAQLGSLPAGHNAETLDISSLEAGFYTLQLQCSDQKDNIRLIVAN